MLVLSFLMNRMTDIQMISNVYFCPVFLFNVISLLFELKGKLRDDRKTTVMKTVKFQRFFGQHFCQSCDQNIPGGVYYVNVEDIDLVRWAFLPATCFTCQQVKMIFFCTK